MDDLERKVHKIVRSCKTPGQLKTARRVIELAAEVIAKRWKNNGAGTGLFLAEEARMFEIRLNRDANNIEARMAAEMEK